MVAGRVPGLTGQAQGLPAELCPAPAGAPLPAPPSPAPGLSAPPGRLQLFRMRGGGPEGAGPRMGLRSQEPAGRGIRVRLGTGNPKARTLCISGEHLCVYLNVFMFLNMYICVWFSMCLFV